MTSGTLEQAALTSFRLLMRPIATLMLRCGVTWKELAELMKLVYVQAAAEEYGKYGRPTNTSRIAILTGLSRREVKRVRDLLATTGPAPLEKINFASRVLSGWFQDPEFVDGKGKPRLLPVEGKRSFEALMRRYAPDIPLTAMLKELEQVGAIRRTPSGRLRAESRFYMPAPMDPENILRTGSVVNDIAKTIAHNVVREDRPRRFEGRATNLRVKRSAVRPFRDYVEQRGMVLLEDADRWLTDHEATKPDDATLRLGVGVYLIIDD
jgi:hypothetical protein